MKSLVQCRNIPEFWDWVLRGRCARPISIRQLSQKLKYSSDRSVGMAVSGQRSLGPEMAERLAQYLKLTDRERNYLVALISRERAQKRGEDTRVYEARLKQLRGRDPNYVDLSSDDLNNMTQWYYFALLELVENFKGMATLNKLERAFCGKVSEAELQAALSTLLRIGFIKQDLYGRYQRQTPGYYLSTSDVPSKAIRETHKNMLRRATEVLEEQSVLDREFMLKVMSISKSDVPRFKIRLQEMMEQLSHEFIRPEVEPDAEVYQLGAQLFRLAQQWSK